MQLDSSIAAVVTGGASGLDLATVKALRQRSVRVAIFDFNAENGEKTAAETGSVFCQVDVTDEAETVAAFERARAANGHERVLVNCAGGAAGTGRSVSRKKTGEIVRYDMAAFEATLQLNTVGTFRCITISAAGMMTLDPLADGDRGAIVNTASAAAVEGQIGQVAYSAAKAGIVGMTLTIARDLANEAIRVNTIMPGTMATPPMERFAQYNPAGAEALANSVPFPRRMGHPSEFAPRHGDCGEWLHERRDLAARRRHPDAAALTTVHDASLGIEPLEDAELEEFMRLFTQHVVLELFAARFGRPTNSWPGDRPPSPFQNYLDAHYSPLPKAVTHAIDYRNFLDAMFEHGAEAIVEFRWLRSRRRLESGYWMA